jgi:hypothetical protein
MTRAGTHRPALVRASFDDRDVATLVDLVELRYDPAAVRQGDALPSHVRSASAVRAFGNRLVIVQDDVDALATRASSGAVAPVLLPERASGQRVFDETLGNKHEKLDLEACVALEQGRLVAFGSGLTPARERLVVWDGTRGPRIVGGGAFYAVLRDAALGEGARLNIEGAATCGGRLLIFHRGNDASESGVDIQNLIVDVDLGEFLQWLDSGHEPPSVNAVVSVDLGEIGGVPFTFTDAVVVDAGRIVVLACAEQSVTAIDDGPVLGSRVGVLAADRLRMVDVCDAAGARALLKLEGIERRPATRFEFDVVADMDRPDVPAQLGRLVWKWE